MSASFIVEHTVAGLSAELAQLLGDLAIELQDQTGSEATLRTMVEARFTW